MLIHLYGAGMLLLALLISRLAPLNAAVPQLLALYLLGLLLLWRARSRLPELAPARRFSSLEAGAVLFWAALIRAVFLVDPPSLSDDIYRYVFEGRVVLEGLSPYLFAPDSLVLAELRDSAPEWHLINHKELPAIYPPGAQVLFAVFAWIRADPLFFRCVFTFLDLAVVWLVLSLVRQSSGGEGNVLLYAWHPLPALELSGSGHLEVLGILPLLVGFLVWRRGAALPAFGFWGWSLSIKFVGGIAALFAAPLLLASRGSGVLLRASLCLLVPILVFSLPFLLQGSVPLGSIGQYLRHWASFPALFAGLDWLLGHQAGRWVSLGCLALWVMVVMRRNLVPAQAFAWFFAAMLLLSPVVHPWYGLWLLVLVPLYPSLLLFLLSSLLPFAYLAWTAQLEGGPWRAPGWAQLLAYGVPILAWCWERLASRAEPVGPVP